MFVFLVSIDGKIKQYIIQLPDTAVFIDRDSLLCKIQNKREGFGEP